MAFPPGFAEDMSRWGLFRATYGRLMGFIHRWLVVCRVQVRPLLQETTIYDPGEGIAVRVASREDLLRATQEMPGELSVEFIDAALGRGDFCVAAFDGCSMISFVWRSFTTAPHVDGLWVAFEKPYRYGYKAFTRPEYRGRHLRLPIARLTDQLCVDRGYTYALGFVETHNYASIAAAKRNGNQCVGFAGYVRLFGRSDPWRSFGASKHSFLFYETR